MNTRGIGDNMKISSYKDVDGNTVKLGDTVETLYGEDSDLNKIGKAVEMKKRGHLVRVRLEGSKYVWYWGRKHTRLLKDIWQGDNVMKYCE
jgi:hypothetical protein